MLSGIEKYVDRLKGHLHLKDSDIKGGSVNIKRVITAWLKPKNEYEPSWRKLAQAVGSMTDVCGDAFYHKIIEKKTAEQWDSATTTPAAQLPEGMIMHSYNGCVGIQNIHLYQVSIAKGNLHKEAI